MVAASARPPVRLLRFELNQLCLGGVFVRETTTEVRFIPGGTFRMGSKRHYPEEAPVREIAVADFWIDRTVTNRQFRQFVNETGHITLAELRPKDYPVRCPKCLKPAH